MVRGHPAGGTRRVSTAGGVSYACRTKPLTSKHSYRDPTFYDDARFGTRKGSRAQILKERKWMRYANRTAIGVPKRGGGSYGDTVYWSFVNSRPGKGVFKLGGVDQDILSRISAGTHKWPRKKRTRAPKFGPPNRPPPPRRSRGTKSGPPSRPPPPVPTRPPPRTPMGPLASGGRKRPFPSPPSAADPLPSKRARVPKFSVPELKAAGLL